MDAVNLLPVDYRDRKRKRTSPTDNLDGRRTLRVGGVAALLFVVLLGGLFFREHQVISKKQKDLSDTKAQITTVQPQVDAIKAAQQEVSGRLALAQSLTSTRMNWDKALNDFARIIPTDSFLTSIQMTAPVLATAAVPSVAPTVPASTSTDGTTTEDTTAPPTPTATPGISTLSLAGTSSSTKGVARVMDRLALLPWLSNVTLASAARQDTGQNSFNMSATVSEAK
jgi:Tfp pilus assembly protein PilN